MHHAASTGKDGRRDSPRRMLSFEHGPATPRSLISGSRSPGATTYRGMMGFWPHVAENPAVSPAVQANPDLAGLHQEIGVRINETPKIVVSDSLTTRDTGPWSGTTTIVRRADAHKTIAELKAQPGKDILTFGSRVLWNDLLAAGLVDELYLMVGHAVLGGGTPAFAQPHSLRLLDTRRAAGSDNVLLRYGTIHI